MDKTGTNFVKKWINDNVTAGDAGSEQRRAGECRVATKAAGHSLSGEEFHLGSVIERLIEQRVRELQNNN